MNKSAITEQFSPDGQLASVLPGFEFRPSQAQLAAEIQRCLRRGDIGLYEAGTGTGKSLAYIIPAAERAFQTGKPVVISTHTIALQEQLLGQDIPIVQKIFPDLRAAVVKGWGNYICHMRLDDTMKSDASSLFPEQNDELLRIYKWAQQTDSGTVEDLSFQPSSVVWNEVNAESDSCLRVQCPFYDRCHFFKDRANMLQAHLLIVNHHLLFADIAIRRATGWDSEHGILPAYSGMIIDEAHHIEDVATDHLGSVLSSVGMRQLLGRLIKRRRKGGLIDRWRHALQQNDVSPRPDLETLMLTAVNAVESCADELFKKCAHWTRGRGKSEQGPMSRIDTKNLDRWQSDIVPSVKELRSHLDNLAEHVARAIGALPKDSGSDDDSGVAILKSQMNAVKNRVDGVSALLFEFESPDTSQNVYWTETYGRDGRQVRLVSAPIDIGDGFVEWISETCNGLVLVSATLALDGSFRYTRERLGLDDIRDAADRIDVIEAVFPSPFDYEEQVMLAIVNDLPDPSKAEYTQSLVTKLHSFLKASDGRALVLFTSYSLLDAVKDALSPLLEAHSIPLLAQGEAPRYTLLRQFRENKRSILLGTSSFWEGVDVPGESLSVVILTKLPFDVPTDPVHEARSERLVKLGQSPFYHYSLPRAALKLKQGFGRLIRNEHDRGAVIICDRRVIDKSYGQTLLNALPVAKRVSASSDEITRRMSFLFA